MGNSVFYIMSEAIYNVPLDRFPGYWPEADTHEPTGRSSKPVPMRLVKDQPRELNSPDVATSKTNGGSGRDSHSKAMAGRTATQDTRPSGAPIVQEPEEMTPYEAVLRDVWMKTAADSDGLDLEEAQ